MQKVLHAILVNFQFQPLNKNCEKIKKAKNEKVKKLWKGKRKYRVLHGISIQETLNSSEYPAMQISLMQISN